MDEQPNRGRILALDYGKRRIGLAISDAIGITAQGLETLHRTRIREDLDYLADLATERRVDLFLFGDPIHMSGEQSRQGAKVREFADRLHKKTSIAVEFWDERWTTKEANRVLLEGGVGSRQKRTVSVDRLSAVLLLENYLEWLSLHAGDEA